MESLKGKPHDGTENSKSSVGRRQGLDAVLALVISGALDGEPGSHGPTGARTASCDSDSSPYANTSWTEPGRWPSGADADASLRMFPMCIRGRRPSP